MWKKSILLAPLFFASFAFANDFPLNGGPFENIQIPKQESLTDSALRINRRNDVMAIVRFQSPVKSQLSRAACSIFSMTGLLESLLIKSHPEMSDLDLSEEWLQYTVALRSKSGGANGSTVALNFGAIKAYGQSLESNFPYSGADWTDTKNNDAVKKCNGLANLDLTRCLVSHHSPKLISISDEELRDRNSKNYDPEFAAARSSANSSKKYLSKISGKVLQGVSEIKALLDNQIPVTADVRFYYGAWNHSRGNNYGIGTDPNLLFKGIVTYPEPGSMDAKYSPQHPDGHSIVIVGYDDDIEVTYEIKMTDGSMKSFTRRGVYIFKNSWGTGKFGRDFSYAGQSLPGYGMITQDYANNYSQFYKIAL